MGTVDNEYNPLISSATPESVGIPSKAVLRVLKGLNENQLPMHSFLILRHGKLINESYWKPYNRDRKHRLYSVSKSITSLAVGIMADEGKLSLDDPIVKYFPEYVNNDISDYHKRATIREMLTMTDCHDENPYSFEDNDFAKTWFDNPSTHPAGSVYSYNTGCTNLCCAIVEKISGTSLIEYLYPRLLEPIGASQGIKCIKTPEGYSYGGSGVLATPLDLALIAQVCLNNGKFSDKQLISEEYIHTATSYLVDNSTTGDTIDDQQGYGYQIWRTRHNGFAFYGMGSQLAICFPDQDLVFVTTGDTQGITNARNVIFDLIFNELFPVLSDVPLVDNTTAQEDLNKYNSSLELPVVPGALYSPIIDQISSKSFVFRDNPMNIITARFDFNNDEVVMTYTKPSGEYKLRFGMGKLIKQTFPETHYSGMQIGVPANRGYESRASAAWSTENCLRAKLYITDDYFGSMKMNAVFKGDELTIIMTKIAEDFLHDYQGTATGTATGTAM